MSILQKLKEKIKGIQYLDICKEMVKCEPIIEKENGLSKTTVSMGSLKLIYQSNGKKEDYYLSLNGKKVFHLQENNGKRTVNINKKEYLKEAKEDFKCNVESRKITPINEIAKGYYSMMTAMKEAKIPDVPREVRFIKNGSECEIKVGELTLTIKKYTDKGIFEDYENEIRYNGNLIFKVDKEYNKGKIKYMDSTRLRTAQFHLAKIISDIKNNDTLKMDSSELDKTIEENKVVSFLDSKQEIKTKKQKLRF